MFKMKLLSAVVMAAFGVSLPSITMAETKTINHGIVVTDKTDSITSSYQEDIVIKAGNAWAVDVNDNVTTFQIESGGYLWLESSKGGVKIGEKAVLTLQSDNGYPIVVKGIDLEKPYPEYGIVAEEQDATGYLKTQRDDIDISAQTAAIISAGEGSTVNLNSAKRITINGAIIAGQKMDNTVTGQGAISLTASKGLIRIIGDTVNRSQKNISITGENLQYEGDISNKNKGLVKLNQEDLLLIEGNINSENPDGGVIAVFNRNPFGVSYALQGAINANGNQDDLGFNNGASWDVTGKSYVKKLTLQNAKLNLNDNQVEIEQLVGTDNTLQVDLANKKANLKVNDADLGSELYVEISDKTKLLRTADELLTPDVEEAFGKVDGYGLNKMALVTKAEEGLAKGETVWIKDGEKIVEKSKKSSAMQNTLDLTSGVMLSFNRMMMNDTRKRMGDLRQATGNYGAWVRYDGGRLTGEYGLENDFNMLQLGWDTKLASAPDWRFGVAASYMEGDADFRRGSADTKGFSLAAYGLWMPAETGIYTDIIARVAKQDNDLVFVDDVKGGLDGYAYSISGEFGYRLPMTDSLYIEPQAELAYTFLEGDSMETRAVRYEIDDTDSLVARLGLAMGYNVMNRADLYIRASVLQEFLGDTSIDSGLSVIDTDGKDSWVEFALGGNFKVSDNAYVWADVERTESSHIDEDWRATVGARISF